jgi:hypothetical protein
MILTDLLKSSMETARPTADEAAFMPGVRVHSCQEPPLPPLRWDLRELVFCRKLAVLPRHLGGARLDSNRPRRPQIDATLERYECGTSSSPIEP